MYKKLCILILLPFVLSFAQEGTSENPFFTEWTTPDGTAPFNLIKTEHYLPAFNEGIQVAHIETLAIIHDTKRKLVINAFCNYRDFFRF